jgi:CMP-N,N'-diacetyllegionaminic acid synthase
VRFVGLITARGGSKGLPGKHTLQCAGRPLIGWTIEAARGSRRLARTITSTDSMEIIDVASRYGADIPFVRPAELAKDDTAHNDVMRHAISWLTEAEKMEPTYLVLLQPTSPLRTSRDIDAAIEIAVAKDADSVISVCPTKSHPFWTKKIASDGRLEDLPGLPSTNLYQRRQTLPEAYALNGAVYVIRSRLLMEGNSYFTSKTYAYVMPPERSIDIDTRWDFEVAELALKQLSQEPL